MNTSLELNYLPRLPKDKHIGIGCIGSGFIMADCHLVAYRSAGFNPVAITSRTPGKAQEVADRHDISTVHKSVKQLVEDPQVEVVDIAVPPNLQLGIIREILDCDHNLKGILAQKPIADNYQDALEIVESCEKAGIVLGVNQNMRYDHSIRATKDLIDRGLMGDPVLATIDMRAIPHWLPWHETLGYLTLRNMSIHHLDTFRYLFGDPEHIYASVRPDPRTKFAHEDGICLYILEYASGLRAMACDDVWAGPAREGAEDDIYLNYRIEGTDGMINGTIGWPKYPAPTPSTIDYTTKHKPGYWFQPRWKEVWFPDAFVGTMAQLLVAIEEGTEPEISGRDNLKTMALIEAAYQSVKEKRAIAPSSLMEATI